MLSRHCYGISGGFEPSVTQAIHTFSTPAVYALGAATSDISCKIERKN